MSLPSTPSSAGVMAAAGNLAGTGKATGGGMSGGRRGFTLIELVLVMVILASVLGVAAPSLSRFFRGRNLDSEAQRLLSLTRHGAQRSIAEGIPMDLWFDIPNRRYGLRADPTWEEDDGYAAEFEIADDVDLELRQADLNSRTNSSLDIREPVVANGLPTLRFMPDGSFGPSSPEWMQLQGRRDTGEEQEKLWIAPGLNRLNYELWTNQPPQVR